MNLRQRLQLGFGINLLLLVVLGIIAILGIKNLEQQDRELYLHPFVVSNSVREITTGIVKMHRSMKDVVLAQNQDQVIKELNKINKAEKVVLNNLKLVIERYLGDKSDAIKLRNDFRNWVKIRDQVTLNIKQGKRKEAIRITKEEGAQYVAGLVNNSAKLIDFADKKAAEYRKKVENLAKQTFYLIVITFVIAFVFGLFMVKRTIDKIIDANREKEEMQNHLFQSSKLASMGELAAGVGHEINNPLAIIKGSLNIIKKELLLKNNLNMKIGGFITDQEDAIERVSAIVKGLNTFSRMNVDHNQILDIHELIIKTQYLTGKIYDKEGINFKTDLLATKFAIEGDAGRFQQIVMILISNAKDAVEKCNNPLIVIKTDNTDDELIVSISDNGSGIKDEIKDKIFESFFTTKDTGKGTGIGLGLLSKIVRDMNGRVELDSKIKNGSTFHLFFPIVNEHKVKQQQQQQQQQQHNLPSKVLVVDDEPKLLGILIDILEDLGISRIMKAENGEVALDLIENNEFDIIMTDLKMPVMDGVTLIKNIKNMDLSPRPLLIAVTGGVNENMSPTGVLGKLIDGYIIKPFNGKKIEKVLVEAAIRKKEMT